MYARPGLTNFPSKGLISSVLVRGLGGPWLAGLLEECDDERVSSESELAKDAVPKH